MKRKIVLILLCVLLFLIVSLLSFVYFFFNTNKTNSDMSYEMRNVLKTEISNLENTLKENNVISKKVSYDSDSNNGEYWITNDVSDLSNSIYMNMGFTYEQLCCEVYLLYRNNVYTVEFSFGNTDLSCLTDESKAWVEKILNIFNSFCDTDSFMSSNVEKNYSNTYFVNNYENEKYEAFPSNKQHGIDEMCSYEVIGEKESYTYFCSKYSSGELFPCQISITYDRTVDKELVLEKGGDSND